MGTSKIDWTDKVLNPVWGCNRNCNKKDHGFDCYAKKFACRIGKSVGKSRGYSDKIIEDMINFKPVLFPDWNGIFDNTCKGKSCRIFVNSMSDIAFWDRDWIEKILNKIKEYQQHIFIFLTKNHYIYNLNTYPKNCLKGLTITNQYFNLSLSNVDFISIEPILKFNIIHETYKKLKWIIVGAETGNRKEKVIPRLEWIVYIVNYCQHYNIPLFMKDSLKGIYGQDLIREFPE